MTLVRAGIAAERRRRKTIGATRTQALSTMGTLAERDASRREAGESRTRITIWSLSGP